MKKQNYVPTSLDQYLNENKSITLTRQYGNKNSVVVASRAPLRNQVLAYVMENEKVTRTELKKFIFGLNEGKAKPAAVNMFLKRNEKFFVTESKGSETIYKLSKLGEKLIQTLAPTKQSVSISESKKVNEYGSVNLGGYNTNDDQGETIEGMYKSLKNEGYTNLKLVYNDITNQMMITTPHNEFELTFIPEGELAAVSDSDEWGWSAVDNMKGDLQAFGDDDDFVSQDKAYEAFKELIDGSRVNELDEETQEDRIEKIVEQILLKRAKSVNEAEEAEEETPEEETEEETDNAEAEVEDAEDDAEAEDDVEDDVEDEASEDDVEDETPEEDVVDDDRVEVTEFIITVDDVASAIEELGDLGIEASEVGMESDVEDDLGAEDDLEEVPAENDDLDIDLEDDDDLEGEEEVDDFDLDLGGELEGEDEVEESVTGMEQQEKEKWPNLTEEDEDVTDELSMDDVEELPAETEVADPEAEEVEGEDEPLEDEPLEDEPEDVEGGGNQIRVSADNWEALRGWLEAKGVDIEEMFGGEIELEGEEGDVEDEISFDGLEDIDGDGDIDADDKEAAEESEEDESEEDEGDDDKNESVNEEESTDENEEEVEEGLVGNVVRSAGSLARDAGGAIDNIATAGSIRGAVGGLARDTGNAIDNATNKLFNK